MERYPLRPARHGSSPSRHQRWNSGRISPMRLPPPCITSQNWNATANSAAWASDSDVPVIPDELVLLGVIWRWRRHKGMDYQDPQAEYEAALNDLASFDDRAHAMRGTRGPRRAALQRLRQHPRISITFPARSVVGWRQRALRWRGPAPPLCWKNWRPAQTGVVVRGVDAPRDGKRPCRRDADVLQVRQHGKAVCGFQRGDLRHHNAPASPTIPGPQSVASQTQTIIRARCFRPLAAITSSRQTARTRFFRSMERSGARSTMRRTNCHMTAARGILRGDHCRRHIGGHRSHRL